MFLAGVGGVDFTRALSQRVLVDVQIVTYSLIIATRNVRRKMKFAIIVARKVTMHVAVDHQIVRPEVQVVVQIEVQVVVQVEVEVEVTTEVEAVIAKI